MLATDGWMCRDCGANDLDLVYSSGRMARCKDCQRFYNVNANAGRHGRRSYSPVVKFSRDEFLRWSRREPRVCAFCRIPERNLRLLDIRTSIGLPLEALGIDRLDNNSDYSLANIALCCFVCNKAKGNVFTAKEMRESIGPAIGEVWRLRLKQVATPS